MGSGGKGASQGVPCPRCGYDQSGIIASWSDSCPLAGACSECGLEFAWSDVAIPGRAVLPGFIEHESPGAFGAGLWTATWRTWAWTLFPWRFWSRVKLHHRVRWTRWVVWALVLIGGLHLFCAAIRTSADLTHLRRGPTAVLMGGMTIPIDRRMSLDLAAAVFIEHLAHPLVQIEGTWYPDTRTTPARPRLVRPWHWRATWFPDRVSAVIAVTLGAWCMYPLMLCVLPATRKEAKVRTMHVARATVYSLGVISILESLRVLEAVRTVVMGKVPMPRYGTRGVGEFDLNMGNGVNAGAFPIMFIMLVWLSAWWYCAIGMGFKIRRARLVWGVTMVTMLLAVVIVVCATDLLFKPY